MSNPLDETYEISGRDLLSLGLAGAGFLALMGDVVSKGTVILSLVLSDTGPSDILAALRTYESNIDTLKRAVLDKRNGNATSNEGTVPALSPELENFLATLEKEMP